MTYGINELGTGMTCLCVPRAATQFIIAHANGEAAQGRENIAEVEARHGGKPGIFSFAVMGVMYLGCARGVGETTASFVSALDIEDDWPYRAAMAYIGANLAPGSVSVAYDAWMGLDEEGRAEIMGELAMVAIAEYEAATGHSAQGDCLHDPCPSHERAAVAHNN